jgi:hypothetical protein
MDGPRFDTLVRRLSRVNSRRRTLGVMGLGALGLTGLDAKPTAAKKKKACPPCKKRKKGKCKGTLPDGTACDGGTCQRGSCVPLTCIPQCAGKVCGDDGCGGICGVPCGPNRVCQGGACVCATVSCGGRCCSPGQVCLDNGSCAHPCTSTSDEFPAPDCPCPDSICAQSIGGGKYCSLPTHPDSCGPRCATTAGCGQGRVCHHLGFGTCELGQHCVLLCNG